MATSFVLLAPGPVRGQEVEMMDEAEQTQAQAEQPGGQANAASFDLLELRIKGNSLIEKKQLERTIYPFLGPKKSIDIVEQARASLEELYRSLGYQTVAVDIPEQDVKNGVVYLQVSEGKISKLRVKDSRYFDQGRIKATVSELAEGTVPNFPKMQAQLAELTAQSNDRQIVPILRAGETPGTLEVDLKVKDELPLHAKLEINAHNTANTSRLRTIASVRYDNLWQKYHSASLMYQTAPENPQEVDVLVGSYVMPVFDSDKRLAMYAVSSSSTSQVASAGALAVIGTGDIYGARLISPLKALKDYSHNLTVGFDYKDFKEDLALLGADTLKTPIHYLPFMAQYSGVLRGKESLLSFNFGVNFAIRGLGSEERQFAEKRFLARSNYAYLTGGLNFRHDLPWDMMLVSRVNGQYADSPMISNEQFSMGGAQSVRGYLETHALADDGITGSLELYSPRLAPNDWEKVDNLRLLWFVDGGRGWLVDALPGNEDNIALASTGMGLRFDLWRHLQGEFDFAIPLLEQGDVRVGENRVDFRLATQF
ncbi:BamA/TamA family outer membrane protein [Methylomonas sp. SURF-2]|uniref:BamA/TamA family outer membrane protein n=1 Tax=Methylomonas subterranea TaxID=2952225 RepID=A0ABT1TDI8_9GAMM|nr:ShlB/FhaC/HecB family hemolysin secretion/activation protein [Methylomonas sp. SURF-2]MCQ8103514.1 BamA/TamA family outer membrane protein [Methylomonas sp. SURF-2]